MRRLLAITVLLTIAGAAVALIAGTSAHAGDKQTFDVIFDDGKGLIGGQQVKVAGATAGQITKVTVTPDFKAKVQATIDSKFSLRQNATCTIRPEGLIAENYVDCDPGTMSSPPLKSVDGTPTVPVEHTSEPVSLLDLFNIFNLPTRERFQVIVDEFGVGTAGRGDDFNDILRRANPALKLANQAIGVLTRQKNQLADIIDQTNTVAAEGASHTQALHDFLDSAANLNETTAKHTTQISQTIQRLPAMLDQAEPSLQSLDSVAVQGTPLLKELRAAAPSLNRVSLDIRPFVKIAKPGLAKLSTAIKQAIPAIRRTTPLVSSLRNYLINSNGNTQLFSKLAVNLQQHGFFENFQSIIYYIGSALAREDGTSHMLATLLVGPNNGTCSTYSTTPVAGCEAHYAAQASGSTIITSQPVPQRAHGRAAAPNKTTGTTTQPAPSAGTTTTGTSTTSSTTTNPVTAAANGVANAAGGTVNNAAQGLQNLLNYLTK